MKKTIVILATICVIAAFFGGVGLYRCHLEEQRQEKARESVMELAQPKAQRTFSFPACETFGPLLETEASLNDGAVDLVALRAVNSDCVGWLEVSGTDIAYPVMQTPENPEHYLYLDFYGNASPYGTPFLDSVCDLRRAENRIVYGHNINEGEAFGELVNYESEAYFHDHPAITLQTESGVEEYRIFSACRVNVNHERFPFDFISGDERARAAFIDKAKEKALYGTGTVPEPDGKILTLSTCQNSAAGGRFIVIAVQGGVNAGY